MWTFLGQVRTAPCRPRYNINTYKNLRYLDTYLHSYTYIQVHWFMLALSDHLVLQALLPPTQGFSMYESAREGALFDPFTSPFNRLTAAPVSAFSRYAAIYSLHGDVSIRYGRSCGRKVSTALLSHQSHGNWVCDPKMFY